MLTANSKNTNTMLAISLAAYYGILMCSLDSCQLYRGIGVVDMDPGGLEFHGFWEKRTQAPVEKVGSTWGQIWSWNGEQCMSTCDIAALIGCQKFAQWGRCIGIIIPNPTWVESWKCKHTWFLPYHHATWYPQPSFCPADSLYLTQKLCRTVGQWNSVVGDNLQKNSVEMLYLKLGFL